MGWVGVVSWCRCGGLALIVAPMAGAPSSGVPSVPGSMPPAAIVSSTFMPASLTCPKTV